MSETNVEAGTFILNPTDGSDAFEYGIAEDTAAVTEHKGTLEGLTTTVQTLAVDVDGDVKLVHQGTLEKMRPDRPRDHDGQLRPKREAGFSRFDLDDRGSQSPTQ